MAGEMRRQIAAGAMGPPEKSAPPSEAFLKTLEVWRRHYRLGEDFVGFQGHFEGRPVLPALAQVFIAQDMVQALEKRPVTLEVIIQAKFLSPVSPGRLVSVYAKAPEKTGEWRLHLTSRAEGDPTETDVAFLRIKFKENGHGL